MTLGIALRTLGVILSLFTILASGHGILYDDYSSPVPVIPHMFRTVFAMNSLLYTFISNSTAYVTSTQFATGISGENGILSSGNWFYTFRVTIQAANQAAMFTIQKIFHKLNETETKHAFWWHMQGGLADESSATVCTTIPDGPPCYAEGIDLTWLDPRNKLAPHDLSYAGNTTVFSPWGEVLGFENGTISAGWWRSRSACKDIFIGHIPSVSIQKYIDWVVAERELSRATFALSEEIHEMYTNRLDSQPTFDEHSYGAFGAILDKMGTAVDGQSLSLDEFLQYQAEQLCASPVLILRERSARTEFAPEVENEWMDSCVEYVLERRRADRAFVLNAGDTVEQGLRYFSEYLLGQNYERMQPMMQTVLASSGPGNIRNAGQAASQEHVANRHAYFPPHLSSNGFPPIPAPGVSGSEQTQDEQLRKIADRWKLLTNAYASIDLARSQARNPLFQAHTRFTNGRKSSSSANGPSDTPLSLAEAVKDAEVFPAFVAWHSHDRRRTRYNHPDSPFSRSAPRNLHTYRFPNYSRNAHSADAEHARFPPYLYYAPILDPIPDLQSTLSQPVLYSSAEYQPSSGFCNLNNRSYNYHPSLHGFLPLAQASQTSQLFALPKACENVTTPHKDDPPTAGTMISLLWYIISLCISFIIGCIVFYVFSYTNAKRREENEADVRNNYLLYEEFQRLNAAYGEQQVQAFPGRVELM